MYLPEGHIYTYKATFLIPKASNFTNGQRKSGYAADTMTRRAAGAQTRTDPHQHAATNKDQPVFQG